MEARHHTANTAEPTVKPTRYYIMTHIATEDAGCSIQLWLWSKMIPQIQDTLNMLRTSRNNNKLTLYEEIKGAIDHPFF